MKMRSYRTLRRSLLPAMAFALIAGAAELSAQETSAAAPSADEQPATETLGTEKEKELQAVQEEVTDLLGKAKLRAKDGKIDEALDLFQQAKAAAENFPMKGKGFVLLKRVEEEMRKYSIVIAEDMFVEARNDFMNLSQLRSSPDAIPDAKKVITKLADALGIYYLGLKPGRGYDADELQKKIDADPMGDNSFGARVEKIRSECEEFIAAQEYVNDTSLEALDPRYKDRQIEIRKLLAAAEHLYKTKQYDLVRDKAEQVLVLDPYNEQAIFLLNKTYRRLYDIADQRLYNEMLKDRAATEWAWIESVPETTNFVREQPREYQSADKKLFDRMNSIILPNVSFRDIDVAKAIIYLRDESKSRDPQGKGIDIVIMPAVTRSGKTVTLELDQIPMYEAVRYVCKQTGFAFQLNDNSGTLTIGDPTDMEEMVREVIPVRQSVIERITGVGLSARNSSSSSGDDYYGDDSYDSYGDDSGDGGGGGLAAGATVAKRQEVASQKLKEHFKRLGISFDSPRTKIAYDVKSSKLTVVNTPERVHSLAAVIRQMDVENPLIQIEAKILEIRLTDMEDLGFDWVLQHMGGNEMWNFTMSTPLRSASTIGIENDKLINNMNILPNMDGDNVWNLYFTLHALDQTGRTEILATPKVVTLNNEEATVQMVREMYFPETWTEPEINTNCGTTVAFNPSYPEFKSEPDNIGIEFTVTPTLTPNNFMIGLDLRPSITDLTGWSDYSYNYIMGDFGGDEAYPMTLKMPEISERSVVTKMTVTDGETVLIGGILRDSQRKMDDRYPILGDLPLIGRLFSIQASNVEKDNLLISVTTRLVSGDGTPIRPLLNSGIPDYKR